MVAATSDLADEIAEALANAMPGDLGTVEAGGRVFTVRRARSTDIHAIRTLLDADAVSSGHGDVVDDAGWRALFGRIDARPQEWLLVAEDGDGQVAATWQLTVLEGLAYAGLRRVQLEGFAVRGDLRGQGLGGAILDWTVRWSRAQGAGVLQLISNLHRERARAFYARRGFEHSHAGLKLDL